MKWSQAVIPTLREDPQEAEIVSHKLMLRAGMIRKLSGGLYTFLPLGLRALRKVERIVREEMDRAGAHEILMPALQPKELWERSGRYEAMQDVMFNVKDHQDRPMVLGPTHEEVVTDLAAHTLQSYRDLPRTFYQIQSKFRDEIRPRFGLMRAREFIMKDAYSFDLGWDQADKSYQAMYDAYQRIFDRCGLKTRVVEADTGAMGGKWSHEFMVTADSGEDGLVECTGCTYAANLERADRTFNAPPTQKNAASATPVPTPGCKTIEEVSTFLKCGPEQLIKTLIYIAVFKKDGETVETPVAALVPGNREINEKKLVRALSASAVRMAEEDTILKVTGAPVGFAGPVGMTIPVYADKSLIGISGAVTGGNQNDTHLLNVDLDRDARVTAYHDLCVVRAGDLCPKCGAVLQEKRGIEVGHVFKLGTKYSDAFDAVYLDEQGKRCVMVMGCYGIGVTRTLQAIIEQNQDADGIRWPLSVAPYRVAILTMNATHAASVAAANQLAGDLEAMGIDVMLDDRDERPGVKFKDADLIGFPIRVVVGEKSLAQGGVELKLRTVKERQIIPLQEASKYIQTLCANS